MEEGMGSGDRGSDVIKKKSSSGCLIIKKKVNGVSGFGGSSSKKGFESRSEKKRSRLLLTDSGSSEEEPVRRRVREDIIYERRRSGIEDSRMLGFERKRGGIDVFEFDEYDGFDGKRMRMDYMVDRLKLVGRSGDYEGFEIGSSRNVVFDGRKGSVSGGRSRGPNYNGKSRYEEEDNDDDDESHLPCSTFSEKRYEAPYESIRVQGKNGVLKVMVNKKKQQGFPVKAFDYPRADERMSSRSEAAVKKNKVTRPSFYSDSKRPEKPVPLKTEKSYVNSRKALPILSSKAEDKDEDSDSNDSENSLQLEASEQAQRSKKVIDNEHKKTTQTEILTPPTGGKESKVKRGNGTEKQLLREKIRSMLLDRGWKIDYRPRRNRDYLDAVYINPAGTAYWSIIKAYDALQKQLEEEENNVKPCDESTSFTPLPEEIISKLTRQTRKKIERELKKKKRDAVCSKNSKEITRRVSANCTDSEHQEEKVSYNRKHNHKSLRGRLPEADHVSGNDSSDNLYQVKAEKDMPERQSATKSHVIQGRKSRKIGRCTLLVRSSDNGLNPEADGYVPYTGKRTILSWLVDSGIVQTGEKVQYMNGRKTRVMLEGWITKDGIHCGCCSKILTISKFEIHAGSKQRQPFLNIYLESGISLMQCQIDAWNKQNESEREAFHSVDVDGDDPNDDTCGLCGDGGDLICCDGCPSTFHQSCLDIKMLPAGDWHCPNCTCKFCGFAGRSNAKADDRTDSSLLLCSLCEKKYHPSCSQDKVNISVNSGDTANSFCGKNCQEIFSHLQKLLGVKHELESGFSWSLVHRMDPALERLHLGFPQRVECNSKLAVALSVMDECFLPIVDRRSGINLVHNVLYNCSSNFTRLSYSSFYTAILEKGDEIISAASIRYRAFDEYEGIEVAWNQVKLFDFLQSPEDLERLYCEIHLLKTLKHSNIMKFYTSWVDAANRNINFVTEMFTSGTLRQYRQKHKKVNIRALKHWCRQILQGLLYLHSHDPPIIHRDLKCDNIFVNGNQGEVKIGDLGLAAILRKSHAARCVGTPEFMAPEVYAEEYNELVDIYAFGMCVLEMVTFDYPYSECYHPAQIYKKVISGKKPDALYKVNDPEVREFIEKCLATVTCRLPARQLLKDPFLQNDDYGSAFSPLDCRELIGIGSMLRQPSFEDQCSKNSLVNDYSSYLGYEPGVDLDYFTSDFQSNESDTMGNQEDEDFENVGITIKGRKEDDGIFLRLRIVDKEGRIRNIYFPFDVEADTALSVAAEMVSELEITDQEVTKIAEMIDREMISLVPEWNTRSGQEEISDHSSRSYCQSCARNGPYRSYLSSDNPSAKDLQLLHCSRHGCAAMHGRFEEITYQFDATEQRVTDGAPVVSSQSDGVHYSDISGQTDEPELCLRESNNGKQLGESCSEEETKNINDETNSYVGKSQSRNSIVSRNLEDYENEIRQELRWLKAKYEIQLRELKDMQLRSLTRNGSFSPRAGDRKEEIKDKVSSLVPSAEKNEVLLKSFDSGKHYSLCFPVDYGKTCASQETQNFGTAYGPYCPKQVVTTKGFYAGELLPQSLHRATSLPVDAVDY